MELVAGGSVKALIKEMGPLNNTLSVIFLKQILNGLSYLHRENVIHRDLKAANILKASDGAIKIADFGLAKIVEAVKSVQEASKMCGTPYWMAPEIIYGKGFSDRVDIWGVGVTAFEFLQGEPPFRDFDRRVALYQIEMGRTWEKCVEKFPSTVSDDLRDFVMKCVELNPKDRPSAAQLLEHHLFY
jgi:serine/threonine protein kinase